jgi:nucleoside-diphosphate-sugar epimerase
MNIFVVGATGYVGLPLCEALLAAGHQVRALCRSEAKAAPLKALGITCISGDLSDVESLRRGMEGCQQAYHLAAFASAWHKNPQVFYDINVQGTLNVLEAALSTGLEKVVLTSTAGVIGASPSAQSSVHEASNPNVQPTTLYEITKLKAEREAIAFANPSGYDCQPQPYLWPRTTD